MSRRMSNFQMDLSLFTNNRETVMYKEDTYPSPVELYRYPDPEATARVAELLINYAYQKLGYGNLRNARVSDGVTWLAEIVDMVHDVVESFLYSPNPALFHFDEAATFEDLAQSVFLTCKKRLPSILNGKKLCDTKFVIYQHGESDEPSISRERRWGTKKIKPQKIRKSDKERAAADLSDDAILKSIGWEHDNTSLLMQFCVTRLPAQLRDIIRLRLQDKSQEEVGRLLHMTQGAVSRVEAEAKQKLQAHFRYLHLQ